jgi:hypothetical protein
MNVHILIIDDENVSAAPEFFDENFDLKYQRHLEFAYSLHDAFRKGGNGDPVGVRELRYGDENGRIKFEQVLNILNTGSANDLWLIYLDLKWDSAGSQENVYSDFFTRWSQDLLNSSRIDRPGLALAVEIMRETNWRGLLCVQTGTNVAHAKQFLSPRITANNDRQWTCLDAPIRTEADNALGYFFVGIEEFEKRFGSKGLIRYWLNPPCGQMTWFLTGSDYHNPRLSDCCQYKDLPKFLGACQWWEAEQGKFTKRLFEIERSALEAKTPCPAIKLQKIKAGMVSLLFRSSIVLEGLNPDDEITIPVQPGLPFLFSVKEALERAREENNEADEVLYGKPLLLKQNSGRVMIALRQSRDASELVKKVKNPSLEPEDDEVSGSIYRALRAKIIKPEDLDDRAGCRVLDGTAQTVADVEWSASEKELRIFWPVRF